MTQPAAPWLSPAPGPDAAAVAAPPAVRYQLSRAVLLIGLLVAMAVAGIGLLVYLGLRIGPTALAVGTGAAIVPVPVLVACFLWLDRYEPEPLKYLAGCLGWGATIAAGVALLLNTGAVKLVHIPSAVVAVV